MILKNFIFLAADTMRSKAYLQAMVKSNCIPSQCFILVNEPPRLIEAMRNVSRDLKQVQYFDDKEPLLRTLVKNKIEYQFIENEDVNSNDVIDVLKGITQEYIIYSGYGGYILKENLLGLGKKFIHVHAGILPQYRGSTTAYYSILTEGFIGATAIFMEKELDAGDIIAEQKFSIPCDKVSIDHIYEPYIRSLVLIKALKSYLENDNFIPKKQEKDGAETYYIIHPVLKHLAILKCLDSRGGF